MDFHCVGRGVRKADLFVDDRDKRVYLHHLGRLAPRMAATVAAFALMDNHFHVLVRAARSTLGNLFMRLHTVYARYFNERHGVQGHIFERHFRPFPIEDRFHLAATAVYIPLNPVKDLGLATPEAYEFCSYRHLVTGRGPDWLDSSPILEAFAREGESGLDIYRRAVEERVQTVAGKRALYADVPEEAGRRLKAEYSGTELSMILDTLLDASTKARLASASLLPGEAFVLYAALRMRLGSVRRLSATLGICRNYAGKWVREIGGDPALQSLLAVGPLSACQTK